MCKLLFIIIALVICSCQNPASNQNNGIEGKWALTKEVWVDPLNDDSGSETYEGSNINDYLIIDPLVITNYFNYNTSYVNKHSNKYLLEKNKLVIFSRITNDKYEYPCVIKADTLIVTDSFEKGGYEKFYYTKTNSEIPPYYWIDSVQVNKYDVEF